MTTHSLPIARYRFTLRCEAPLQLNEYSGSMLRGAFGHALRAVSCMTGQSDCAGCDVHASCRYPSLFSPGPVTDERGRPRDVPAPYILEADNQVARLMKAGECLTFDMVLFGPALVQLPTIIVAWQRAAYAGLGHGRARCRLEQVALVEESGDQSVVFQGNSPRVVPHHAGLTVPELPKVSSLTLVLETPTRIQHRGKVVSGDQLTASMLLNALARKVELYTQHYTSNGWQRPDLPATLQLTTRLTRQRWARYSSRQKRHMRLDGLVGEVTLSGELQAWLPWVWLGQYTHLGKNSSFGLGRYRFRLGEGGCLPLEALA